MTTLTPNFETWTENERVRFRIDNQSFTIDYQGTHKELQWLEDQLHQALTKLEKINQKGKPGKNTK